MFGAKALQDARESLNDTSKVLRLIAGTLMLILAVLLAGLAK